MSEYDPVIQPMLVISCPTCQRQGELTALQEWPQFPFCSPRCKLIDLGRWLGEDYRLPASETSELHDSEQPAT